MKALFITTMLMIVTRSTLTSSVPPVDKGMPVGPPSTKVTDDPQIRVHQNEKRWGGATMGGNGKGGNAYGCQATGGGAVGGSAQGGDAYPGSAFPGIAYPGIGCEGSDGTSPVVDRNETVVAAHSNDTKQLPRPVNEVDAESNANSRDIY